MELRHTMEIPAMFEGMKALTLTEVGSVGLVDNGETIAIRVKTTEAEEVMLTASVRVADALLLSLGEVLQRGAARAKGERAN